MVDIVGTLELKTPENVALPAVNGQQYVRCPGCAMPYNPADGQLLEGAEPLQLREGADYCSPCNSVDAVFDGHDPQALERLAELDLHMPMPRGSKVFRDEMRTGYNLF